MKFQQLITVLNEEHSRQLAVGETAKYYSDSGYIERFNVIEDQVVFADNNMLLHREDGPALEFDTVKHWYKHGKRHRLDGPATTYSITRLYYIDGKQYTEKDYYNVINGVDKENIKDVLDLGEMF